MTLQPPLIGREREIHLLQDLLEKASAGKGALVFITGEAGIGKTRLTEEFVKHAAAKRCRVMVGRCVPGAPVPYLPFQDALENYFGTKTVEKTSRYSRIVESVKRAAPDIIEVTPIVGNVLKASAAFYKEYRGIDLNPESESERTLHATLEFLRKICAKHLILIVLEDLHWADSASIQLLHFLARNMESTRILIIGTYRPEDITIEMGEKIHPLLDSLRIMRREGVCHELSLDRLNFDETRMALEGMLGGKIHTELVRKIASESGGNPLFAVEIVRLLAYTKSINLEDGVWKATEELRIDIPSTVKEVILRRIDRLPKEEKRILEFAAVVGEWFDSSILEGSLCISRLNLLEILESTEKNFQLVRVTDGMHRFTHEKIRDVVYSQISSLRRKELHRMIAQVLEDRLPDESLYGELSAHYCSANDDGKCLKYSLLAGQSCMKRFATLEAMPYFKRVVEIAKDDPALLEDRLQAMEGLGDAHRITGLFDIAVSFYEDFLRLYYDTRSKARVLRKSAECWHPDKLSNPSKAMGLLDQAGSLGDIGTVELGRIKELRGSISAYMGAFDDAERFYAEAEKLFEQADAIEDLGLTLVDYNELYLSLGLVQKALEKGKRAIVLFSSLQSIGGEMTASYQLGDTYFHLGLAKEALDSYTKVLEIATKFGRYSALAWTYLYRGLVYYNIDDFESAKQEALKAREYALKTESNYLRAVATGFLAYCEIRLNKITEGERLLSNALEMIKSIPMDIRSPMRPIMFLVHAELLAAKKEWTASDAKFQESIKLLRGAIYGQLYEAIVHTRFGEALLKQGLNSEAREHFGKAVRLYEKLGNVSQAKRVTKLMAESG